MPTRKDLKRLVRSRMKKTGEAYTAARARVLAKSPPSAVRARTTATLVGTRDTDRFAALAGMSDASVSKATGRTWKEWVEVLDRAGAARLDHTSIATLVHEQYGVKAWWTQTVTVGYERIRGLRERGQQRDGTYEVAKSKVYRVPLERLWTVFGRCDRWLEGGKLRMSKATKHKSMRMRWSDGTPVEALFLAKGADKSQLSLQHRKIASRDEAEKMRAYWTACLARIGALIAAE